MKKSLLFITFLILIVFMTLINVGGTLMSEYHLTHEYVKVWINRDGTLDLFYDVNVALDSGPPIDSVYVSQPKCNFTIGSALDQHGHALEVTDASSGTDYKVRVNLHSPLAVGEEVMFNLTTNVPQMIYEVTMIPGNVAVYFSPGRAKVWVGDFRLLMVMPFGVSLDMVRTSINWASAFSVDDRVLIYWERFDLSPEERYPAVGVSFPKDYVDEYVRGIYILADGSVDPPTAPIRRDANIYTLAGNITTNVDGIVIQRSNITLDGEGYTVEGNGAYLTTGVSISRRERVSIRSTAIRGFYCGSYLGECSNSIIQEIDLGANNWCGVYLQESSNNSICNNSIENADYGICVHDSQDNRIYENDIVSNDFGIWLKRSVDNSFYHNNFIYAPVYVETSGCANLWDDGYPSGGNYWSDYAGIDVLRGPYQNESGSDGIGDIPYTIDASNTDRYPLINHIETFDVGIWDEVEYYIRIVSNSTISGFKLDKTRKIISFNVTSPPEISLGFCTVTIPNVIIHDFWLGDFTVLVDGEEPLSMRTWADGPFTYIYFKYKHSTHKVTIVPEFPPFLVISLFMITTLLAVMICRRKILHSCV